MITLSLLKNLQNVKDFTKHKVNEFFPGQDETSETLNPWEKSIHIMKGNTLIIFLNTGQSLCGNQHESFYSSADKVFTYEILEKIITCKSRNG